MATRADVNQKVVIGPEATAGIPVEPTRDLPSLSIELRRTFRNQFFRAAGKKYPSSGVRHRERGELRFTGPLDYNEIIYPLSSLFGAPTPAQIGTTSGYRWTFDPQTSTEDVAKTFTVKAGDSSKAQLASHVIFNSLDLSMTLEASEISGEGFSFALEDDAAPVGATSEVQKVAITGGPTGGTFTLTFNAQTTGGIAYNATAAQVQSALEALSTIGPGNVRCYGGQLPGSPVFVFFKGTLANANQPQMTASSTGLTGGTTPTVNVTTEQEGGQSLTAIPQQPVSLAEVNVFIDSTFANIGTTKLTRVLEFALTFPTKRNPVEVLNTAHPAFIDSVEVPLEGVTGRVTAAYDGELIDLITAMNTKAKTVRYLRAKAVGANIGTNADYTFRLDLAILLADPQPRRNLNGVYAYDLNFQVIHDSTMNGALDIEVVNTRSAL